MRIFITGGTGFIGRYLLDALAGHEVLAVSRTPVVGLSSVSWIGGDLSDLSFWFPRMRAFDPKVCVHLAWSGLQDYSYGNNLHNFQLGLSLFDALCQSNVSKIIVTGTCAEYGNLTGCVAENQRPSDTGHFAAFKEAQRAIGDAVLGSRGKSFIWARPFYVYGPGQRGSSLIPSIVMDLRDRKPLTIRTPDVVNDFIHVADVARGLATLIDSDVPSGVYNVGTGRPTPVRNVVDLIARVTNKAAYLPPQTFPRHGFWADTEKMHTLTGWMPQISLEEGVRQTVARIDTALSMENRQKRTA